MDTTTETHSPAAAGSRVAAIAPASPLFAARHFLSQLAFETDPSDLAADLAADIGGLVVVDVRQAWAFAEAHIPGAVNLPHATIDEATTADLDRSALYVTYCWDPACNASRRGAANLASLGFRVKELVGGLAAWRAEGFAVKGTDAAATEETCAC